MRGCAQLGPLSIRWRSSPEVSNRGDYAALLFAGLPPAPPDAAAGASNLTLELVGAPPSLVSRVEEGRPLFFQDEVRAFETLSGRVVTDGRSCRATVDPAGDRIEASIALGGAADDQGSAVAHCLFLAFVLAARAHGLFHAHAGALVDGDGEGLLVAGQQSAGKTTTCLAAIAGGARYLSDDAIFFSGRAGSLSAFAPRRPFHVSEATLAAMPALRSNAGDRYRLGSDKRLLEPGDLFPNSYVARCGAPKLILFPQITRDGPTQMLPLVKSHALGELLTASAWLVLDDPPTRSERLALLREAVDGADAYALRLGADALEKPQRIAELIFERAVRPGGHSR